MGIFDKMKEPVFLKETSEAEKQLEALKVLTSGLNAEGRAVLEQDIRCLEWGIAGEKNIAYELKNSHMPIYILHDIYLEYKELSAQIDYLIFTKKMCFVVECKNLCGNVEINNAGDFIRTMEIQGKKKREGIYSPITQNQRHLELIKQLAMENRNGWLARLLTDKICENQYRSVVVLANPRTVLNARYAPKAVKEKVIRADRLVAYIKDTCRNSSNIESSEKEMREWAESFLKRHKEQQKDYTQKYEKYLLTISEDTADEKETLCPRCGGRLVRRSGKYGEFFGCSSFPRCRYTEKIS